MACWLLGDSGSEEEEEENEDDDAVVDRDPVPDFTEVRFIPEDTTARELHNSVLIR